MAAPLGNVAVTGDASSLPLVVDLDGTLLKTDSLDETLLDALRTDPLSLWRLPFKLVAGRAALKSFLAGKSPLDVEAWPVREDFLAYVKAQAEAGRKIVLATAADRSVAEAIRRRFPFIGEIIASGPDGNNKGDAKGRALRDRFPGGFVYAGNSAADLAAWEHSAGRIVVAAPDGVARRVREPIAAFPRAPMTAAMLRRTFRLHQWAKNLLVFVPLVLGGKAGDAAAWFDAFLGFLALGCAASAMYVFNDLWDLPSDRRHWSKQARPLASGDLPIRAGLFFVLIGLLAGFGLAASVGAAAAGMLGIYVLVTLAYSLAWKRVPVLDVFVLAALFTLRLGIGIAVTDVRLSPWLLVFSMFVFLSLSVAKRHTEILRLAEHELTAMPGRGYVAQDAPLTLGIGLAAMLGAVLIMILYLIEDAFPRGFYASPGWLWIMPAALFLFLGRVWLFSQRGLLHDDPVAFALKDKASLCLGLLTAAGLVAAFVGLGG
ncbi:MAG: UbiA family prenyltransferase [Alphaproteobacteria bacterium]